MNVNNYTFYLEYYFEFRLLGEDKIAYFIKAYYQYDFPCYVVEISEADYANLKAENNQEVLKNEFMRRSPGIFE